MSAVVPFPDRAARNLSVSPAAGYAAITRKVERVIQDHEPHPQAARLTIRAAVLAGATCLPRGELVQALRDLADEVDIPA